MAADIEAEAMERDRASQPTHERLLLVHVNSQARKRQPQGRCQTGRACPEHDSVTCPCRHFSVMCRALMRCSHEVGCCGSRGWPQRAPASLFNRSGNSRQLPPSSYEAAKPCSGC
jgi:hypothetical protein